MDAYIYKGKRYSIPLCFTFEAFEFSDELKDKEAPQNLTIERLLDLADKYYKEGTTTLFDGGGFGMSKIRLGYRLFELDFADFVDMENKEAHVDGTRFVTLLENVQSLDGKFTSIQGAAPLIEQSLMYTPVMSSRGLVDCSNMFLLTNEAGESAFGTIGFLPAINANSGNKDLALDFLSFLISEEIQSSPELMFCPVNRKAVEKITELSLGGFTPEGFDIEKNLASFSELASRVTVAERIDQFIHHFVLEEMQRYFEGEESAEQAARNLQARLNMYLKE